MQEMIQYSSTKDLVEDAYKIVDSSQHFAYRSVNTALVLRNWLLGKRIVEEELKGANRAEYGAEVIKRLSDSLTLKYGKESMVKDLIRELSTNFDSFIITSQRLWGR